MGSVKFNQTDQFGQMMASVGLLLSVNLIIVIVLPWI